MNSSLSRSPPQAPWRAATLVMILQMAPLPVATLMKSCLAVASHIFRWNDLDYWATSQISHDQF